MFLRGFAIVHAKRSLPPDAGCKSPYFTLRSIVSALVAPPDVAAVTVIALLAGPFGVEDAPIVQPTSPPIETASSTSVK